MKLEDFIATALEEFPGLRDAGLPWTITDNAANLVRAALPWLGDDYRLEGELAVHKTATLEQGVIVRGPAIIAANARIAAHAYLRDGVFIGEGSSVGPSAEVKASFVFSNSALAHLNYVGNSLVGSHVNLEAGAVIANHFNEREDKTIRVQWGGQVVVTGVSKFGALIGDHSKIGANAVTTPGTILEPKSVVGRLELVDQLP